MGKKSKLLVIVLLLVATVGYGGDMYNLTDKGISVPTQTVISIPKEQKINLIKQWAKEGLICEVFGHQWGEPVCHLDTVKGTGDGITIRVIRPYGLYRKCEICDKEQKYTPEKWEDFEEK